MWGGAGVAAPHPRLDIFTGRQATAALGIALGTLCNHAVGARRGVALAKQTA